MAEEKELQVRALDGRSTTVKLAAAATVLDLKAALRSTFPPAQISPNFHLFLKGAKLRLEAQVGSVVVSHGEFIVLVPFTRKSQQCPPVGMPGQGQNINPSKSSEVSCAANSAWQDIMDDLLSIPSSPLVDVSSKGLYSSSNLHSRSYAQDVSSSTQSSSNGFSSKRQKLYLEKENVFREIFPSGVNIACEQGNMSTICSAVESVGCLLNDNSGDCLLFEEFHMLFDTSEKCLCSSWMKRLVKTFCFLNLIYAMLQMQCKCMTWETLELALEQSKSFGCHDINRLDVEILSHLFPKVVVVQSMPYTVVPILSSMIVIGSPTDEQCSSSTTLGIGMMKDKKQSSTSTTINALTKRWTTFKSELLNSIRCCMGKHLSKKSKLLEISLQDLMSMKDKVVVAEASNAKIMKSKSAASSCHDTYPMEPAEMVEHLKQGLGKGGQIVHLEEIPGREASYADLPQHLSEGIMEALKHIGISRLYSHQAQAIQSSISGKHVVVATSTSSGKSLCYNIPILESLSQSLMLCAMYIFPTKALAQDQLRTLLKMKNTFHTDLNVKIYDGDTPKEERAWIRDNARLLITNPDMLHMSILPCHSQFQRILSNLRYIVIDEAHSYKGAFGCHTALILRRLKRICSNIYGSHPTFIFCTATSANPREHVMELAKLDEVELIQNDGSPCGPKYFLLWNPPLCMTKEPGVRGSKGNEGSLKTNLVTRRSSPIVEVSYLFAEMVQHGLRCIAFCKTRKLCELVLAYTREILQETAKELVDSLCVYRAGYIAEDRRKIEADLFEGKLRGVAATNALELGIDVGHIDATLHLGFPGSVSSLWQQAGRSGRRAKQSIAVYVAFEGPLDQYFMKSPHKLFGKPIEHCQVDSHNQKVLGQHLACAAYENPLCLQYDESYFGCHLNSVMMTLKEKGYLISNPSGAFSSSMLKYIGPEKRPSYAVSIRAIEHDKYKVINKSNNRLLEEIEESKAFFQVYEGAVYMHQGVCYLVEELDLPSRTAFCRKADLKYYTKTRDYTDINVVGGDFAFPPTTVCKTIPVRTTAQANDCKVTTKWFGFYRIWKSSNKIFDSIELNLPPYSFESQAVWVRIPQSVKTTVEARKLHFRGGAHAASHALLNIVPLYMICTTSDLGTECASPHETRDLPERILLYDKHPGGIGLASHVKMLFGELLAAAKELVSTCSCASAAGCPNCIQSLTCGEYNEVLDKEAAILILKGVIQYERSYFEAQDGPHQS